jgi:hypothetical protein
VDQLKIGWGFPLSGGGREDGPHDSGIEHFQGRPLSYLAREIIQNSLDAKAGPDRPVEVEFSELEVPREEIPGTDDLREAVESCLRYWKDDLSAERILARAQDVLRAHSLTVLKVSDRGTTGVRGPFGDRKSDWFRLTKSVGSSAKGDSAGGSFGIGKHAPFACSALRTVLYCTVTQEGFAFQGVSRLMAHTDRSGHPTQGVGYYGVVDDLSPITDPSRAPRSFAGRSELGTDIFILGFSRPGTWEDEVLTGAVESFLAAIHGGTLVLRVGRRMVHRDALPKLVESLAGGGTARVKAYFDALTSPDSRTFAMDGIEGGSLDLKLLPLHSSARAPNAIAVVRGTGMMVFEKKHFRTPMKFAGVLTVRGDRLNGLLKSLEPPGHDRWEPERGEDPSRSKALVKSIRDWLHECVAKTAQQESSARVNASFVSRYLPDEEPARTDAASAGVEDHAVPHASTSVRISPMPVRSIAGRPAAEVPLGDGDAATVDVPGPTHAESRSTASDGGGGVSPSSDGHDGGEKTREASPETGLLPSTKPFKVERCRAFCTDPSSARYRIIAVPEESGLGFIRVSAVGEDGSAEWVPVLNAESADGRSVDCRNGAAGPIPLHAGERVELTVTLGRGYRCSLGISIVSGVSAP